MEEYVFIYNLILDFSGHNLKRPLFISHCVSNPNSLQMILTFIAILYRCGIEIFRIICFHGRPCCFVGKNNGHRGPVATSERLMLTWNASALVMISREKQRDTNCVTLSGPVWLQYIVSRKRFLRINGPNELFCKQYVVVDRPFALWFVIIRCFHCQPTRRLVT